MTSPIIKIEHLKTYLGHAWVLKNINLEVMPGEIFCIVGGSGSGKSTLLRQILGLSQPSGGTVSIYGKSINRVSFKEYQQLTRKWGVLFQSGALFTSLTLLENITF